MTDERKPSGIPQTYTDEGVDLLSHSARRDEDNLVRDLLREKRLGER